MYFDIHTHNDTSSDNSNPIINVFPYAATDLKPNQKYSIGIHPCFISEKTLESELETMKAIAKNENIVAIGEIGLDRNSETNLELQKEVFLKQLKIAEELDKPIIIHCVKCFSEILELKKDSTVPWIIHGFRGKPELASQLIKKGIFLSFGAAILNPPPTLLSTLIEVPTDKIFLETDDSTADIKLIYKKVAEIKKIPVASLIKKIEEIIKK